MFSLLIPGRLPQLDAQQVDTNRWVFLIPAAGNLNHLVVFLTPDTPFPDGFGATLHFLAPGKEEWQLLGMLSNEKPSAIFRLRPSPSTSSQTSAAVVPSSINSSDVTATLGLSLEPLSSCLAQVSTLPSASNSANAPQTDAVGLAQKVAKNLFNYLSGFGSGNGEVMQVVEKWYRGFEGKVRSGGVAWLEREE
ncbi:DUF775-domain-containing protein [Atractiella rhizophila]|nr:DUF775-domain-containing protein [Atractiella rhizophila]